MTTSTISSCEVELARNVNLQAGAISIGRADDNDLHIPDQTVSAHHARIFTYLDASYIEDLSSTNGTFLNGRRIQKHTLRPGDIIKVGRLELKVSKDN
ncbi:MAG: FHA domain-containing protein [Thioalkalispiraceae bacterium]|jgi:pSer/pThr/pTyr-binding forkhead associated (FHA) protein